MRPLPLRKAGGAWRAVSLLGAVLALVLASAAAPPDLDGWRAARWGMSEADLREAFGQALKPLPGRWEYGDAYAEHALFDVALGGQTFTAYFQMNGESGRLQQVLLQGERTQATPLTYRKLLTALERRYGAPVSACAVPKAGGGPLAVEMTWRFPTTAVHATLLDFYTTAMVFEDPNIGIDPLTPYSKERRNNPQFLPRRVLVRFHPSDREDLMGRRGCLPIEDLD